VGACRYDGEVAGLGLKPAALVLSRVISRPTAERITLDAGSKGIAAEAGSPVALVLGRVEVTTTKRQFIHRYFRTLIKSFL